MKEKQIAVSAIYMRGGTSKGVFFAREELPPEAQEPGRARDAFMLRVIGSPDHYAKHTDGMGGATSSTSKVVIVDKSEQAGHDVDYTFGQVSISDSHVDWSGNCGNLTSAVGAFAIQSGIIDESALPENGIKQVRIWQANIQKSIVAQIPICDKTVQELGDFQIDGVTFPAAEITLDFLDPAPKEGLFPSGALQNKLHIEAVGEFTVTYINAGIPTVFLQAEDLGLDGTELQAQINADVSLLAKIELIRAHAALAMGVIEGIEQAKTQQHTPKIAFVARPKSYCTASGKQVAKNDININVRAMSMGQLHHAMMGTAAVAIAAAAAIPGTLVHANLEGGVEQDLVFGHPSGCLKVLAECSQGSQNNQWQVDMVRMSRSARRLMQGSVLVPSAYADV